MKTKALLVCLLLCSMIAGCSKDDDNHQSQEQPQAQKPKTSEHLAEIKAHKFVEASFVMTGKMAIVSFYTERFDDKYGDNAYIKIEAVLSQSSYSSIPDKVDISSIVVKRQWNYYNVYWSMESTSYGDYKFNGGTIEFTKIDDKNYKAKLKAGPIPDINNTIIENLEIDYTGFIDFGDMLTY
nr:hypothetical protein [uncultured Prevotella sp.]